MSFLKKLLPDSWFNDANPSGNSPEDNSTSNKKGWMHSIHQFNDNVAELVVFNSKLLVFVMLLFFVYLLFASVVQDETFSIRQLNVHPSMEINGYNSGFIAKKISYNITTLVNEVPEKLFALFSSGGGKEKNEILYNRILDKYLKKEIKIDFNVDVGGISLPLDRLTKTARGLLNVEDKTLDGDITIEDSLIFMTLGFNSNAINKSFETKRYIYTAKDTVRMIDKIDSMTLDAAKFVLKQYDPLVTLLIDFNPPVGYSDHYKRWAGDDELEEKRLEILKKIYLNDKKDKELAIWAYAISGSIYSEIFARSSERTDINTLAIQHFEKAIEMDASFVDIVGFDLANSYSKTEDSSKINNVIMTYQKMIKSTPGNHKIYDYLFNIYSNRNDKDAYIKLLGTAFMNGLYIPEGEMTRRQYKKFKDDDQFKALVKKHNEKNKPKF